MKYKVIKEIKLDEKVDDFMNSSAQCMLKLLYNRLFVDEFPDYAQFEEQDIAFDYSMYGREILQMKDEMGYSNKMLKDSAESFVRKL